MTHVAYIQPIRTNAYVYPLPITIILATILSILYDTDAMLSSRTLWAFVEHVNTGSRPSLDSACMGKVSEQNGGHSRGSNIFG